jgi:hypothetical protein
MKLADIYWNEWRKGNGRYFEREFLGMHLLDIACIRSLMTF